MRAASSVVEGFAVVVGSVLGTALAVVAVFEVVAGLGPMWVRGLAVILLAGLGVAMASTKFRRGRPLGFPTSETSEEEASLGTGPGGAPTDQELEDLITRAFDELPRAFRDQISNLGIVIEDEPPDGKPWLATYQGTPLTKRSNQLSWMWPSKITIYRGPLRRLYGQDATRFEQEVRHVVRHELAHYFGISDERLIEINRY